MGNQVVEYHRWIKTLPFHGSCREDLIIQTPQIIRPITHRIRVPGIKADKWPSPRVREMLVLGNLGSGRWGKPGFTS